MVKIPQSPFQTIATPNISQLEQNGRGLEPMCPLSGEELILHAFTAESMLRAPDFQKSPLASLFAPGALCQAQITDQACQITKNRPPGISQASALIVISSSISEYPEPPFSPCFSTSPNNQVVTHAIVLVSKSKQRVIPICYFKKALHNSTYQIQPMKQGYTHPSCRQKRGLCTIVPPVTNPKNIKPDNPT